MHEMVMKVYRVRLEADLAIIGRVCNIDMAMM